MEIKETGTAKKNRVLNMLLYGQPGVGKTTFASYAKNPLIADLERGLTSIVDRNIQYVSVDSVQSFEMAKKIAIEKKYDTFVVDSLTRFCDIAMKDILKKNKKTKPMIADWGELANVVKSMVWDLQSEDISTIFIAHEKITDEDGNEMEFIDKIIFKTNQAKQELEEKRGAMFKYEALLGDRPPPLDYRK